MNHAAMKTPLLIIVFSLFGLASAQAVPDGFIWINVSVKLIAHPDDGGRPRGDPNNVATRITDDSITASLEDANQFLASYQRGYRIRIVETLTIGGLGQRHSNSSRTEPGYYSIQTSDTAPLTFPYPDGYVNANGKPTKSGPLIDVLDQNARSTAATKTAFKWNDNAVNMFVLSGWGGGGGIFPASGNAAGFGFFQGWLFLHELGHYFDLRHTFDETDYVSDTLVDPSSVNQDGIAQELYAKNYLECSPTQQAAVNTTFYTRARNSIAAANVLSSSTYSTLTADEKERVDNVFFNIMSYYDPYRRNQFVTRMTEGQADRLADTANNQRNFAVSGTTRFIDASVASTGLGTSTSPIKTLALGITSANANGNDILLLRPGTYTSATLSKPMTIRATRQGSAQIQKP